ncbi:DNA primase [Streptococcus sciuri]|uniref:DNA primase n=1 Tax=Streptococcus sciuri TaxID=2973939 RepID=A0ABT2F7Q0_9STRE|nr:DNA primase [Streptococcus sciuri]MCS4488051.1 DNA primase [Streptococcus sciuri]
MTLAISRETISEIKSSVNIVEVIGEVVNLTRSGHNYLGLCPFHKEKTPSFNVVEDKQFFHCFGCGKSGDVFKFLEEYRQISFMDSVYLVAERIGVTLDLPKQQPVKTSPHQVLYDLNGEAARFYHAILMTTKEGQKARDYLRDRGLDEAVLAHFNIGLAPRQPDFLYQTLSDKYPNNDEAFVQSGLFNIDEDSSRFYDTFRNRIMFPVTDDEGRVIAFSGRIWTPSEQKKKVAKYKNTRSTLIFNKSYELYHVDKAKKIAQKTHELYLMEGFMDVIAAYQSGIENAVASMGTALTSEHVRHLSRFTKKVVLVYDGDSAGQKAIAKSLELLGASASLSVDVIRIPNQMDPDEFLRHNSKETLKQLLEKGRISNTEFYIQYLRPDNNNNLQAEIAYVEKIAKLIAQEPSITAQNGYINKVAEFLPDFDYPQIEQAVNNERLISRNNRRKASQETQHQVVTFPTFKPLSALIKAEIQLFHRLLHHDYLLQSYRNRLDFAFNTPEIESLYQILCRQGEITSLDLDEIGDTERQMYYRILEERLPDEVALGEMEAIERRREQLLAEQNIRKQSQRIRELSNQGNVDDELEEKIQQLIAQKRKME